MRKLILLASLVALVSVGCQKILGTDKINDSINNQTDALTPTEISSPCDENPQGQGCVDQRNVGVGLECGPDPAVPPFGIKCTATASSFANWYTWNCGLSGSPAPQRGQSDKQCLPLAPGNYRVSVVACEFEKQDDHCDSAEQVGAVLAPMTATEGAAITGDGLEFPGGGG